MQVRRRLATAPLMTACIPLGFLCTLVMAAGRPDAKPSGTPSGRPAAVRETGNPEAIEPRVPAAGRSSVPEAAAQLAGPIHHPQGHLVYVDLGKQANFKLAKGTVQDNHLAELPRGEQTFAGVKFRIGETGIHLAGKRLPAMPTTVEGIPIHRRAIVLYILHATQWGVPQYSVMDGMTIGRYQVHYVDGTAATIPIVCGRDVRDWWSRSEKPVTRGQVAWAGRNPSASREKFYIRLYLTTWENPHPEKPVATIDYSSTMTDAAPFCVAMTTEDPAPTRPAPRAATSGR
ncbi:MAG: hypothetical protein ABSG86_23635 [Thermoguttaceae bacterium]|jgi:hypothetical protein